MPMKSAVNLRSKPTTNLGGNIGPPVTGLQDDRGDPAEEMRAFDQLGPKTRAVINEGLCVNWSAAETLKMLRAQRMNPQSKKVDEMTAKRLRELNPQIAEKLKMGHGD